MSVRKGRRGVVETTLLIIVTSILVVMMSSMGVPKKYTVKRNAVTKVADAPSVSNDTDSKDTDSNDTDSE